MVIANNLTVNTGSIGLNAAVSGVNPGEGTTIGGNVTVVVGSSLEFAPVSLTKVTFKSPIGTAGTAVAQTISGGGSLSFSATNAIFEINNPAGLTLERPVTIGRELSLTLGLINTSNAATLTMPVGSTLAPSANGSIESFVNGPIARGTGIVSALTAVKFPIGKLGSGGVRNYRPMFLNLTTQSSAITYTAEQLETPPTQDVTPPLEYVSYRRSFNLVPNATITGTYSATVELTFGLDDFVNDPYDNDFVVARRDFTATPPNWLSIGRSNATGVLNNGASTVGTLISGAFETFTTTNTNFALGSTRRATFPHINPLPVELTRFSATAKAKGISLDWATATEKNNDRFEVQRSANGETFQTIGTVKGQGNSSSAHSYAFTDSRPLAGLAYYRLRQVDTDGKGTFSTVVNATWMDAAFAVYPNPSTGIVTLPASLGAVQYRVFNVMGQTMLSGQANGNDRLDITTLQKGTFFLELTGAAGRSTQRLVRE